MPKIVFNGQEYDNIDAMPPDIRKLYEHMMAMFTDKDGDNIPDLFQGDVTRQQVTSFTQYIVDGKTYARLEDLPPEARERYTAMMSKIDTNQNTIPDMLEQGIGIGVAGSAPANTRQASPSPVATSIPTVTVVGDRPSPGTTRMIVIGLIILAIVAGFAYFLGTSIGR